jgi:hypothetical protein
MTLKWIAQQLGMTMPSLLAEIVKISMLSSEEVAVWQTGTTPPTAVARIALAISVLEQMALAQYFRAEFSKEMADACEQGAKKRQEVIEQWNALVDAERQARFDRVRASVRKKVEIYWEELQAELKAKEARMIEEIEEILGTSPS